jgi:hypothetical protein
MEEELLGGLPPAERAAFERALVRLAGDSAPVPGAPGAPE